jgi:hypothetical protein
MSGSAILSSKMPQKFSVADGGNSFALGRKAFANQTHKSHQTGNLAINNSSMTNPKPIAGLSGDLRTQRLRMAAIGGGSSKLSNVDDSIAYKQSSHLNEVNSARRRVRGSASVPKINSYTKNVRIEEKLAELAAAEATIPNISETTAVYTPTSTNTPSVVITSDKAGTITSSLGFSTSTFGVAGANTITFNTLSNATYTGETVSFTGVLNTSMTVTLTPFVVSIAPAMNWVWPDQDALVASMQSYHSNYVGGTTILDGETGPVSGVGNNNGATGGFLSANGYGVAGADYIDFIFTFANTNTWVSGYRQSMNPGNEPIMTKDIEVYTSTDSATWTLVKTDTHTPEQLRVDPVMYFTATGTTTEWVPTEPTKYLRIRTLTNHGDTVDGGRLAIQYLQVKAATD